MRWIKLRRAAWTCLSCGLWPVPLVMMAQQGNLPTPPTAPRPELPTVPAPPTVQNRPLVQPGFAVVVDAAHGGSDIGARLGPNMLEKDLTLALSIRLRSALAARGIDVSTTRESDRDLSFDDRASIANHALAAACILLHATATGTGVHLFTSSLPAAAPNPPSRPVPWQTAQSTYISQSLRLSAVINTALSQAAIPATLGRTFVKPLDTLTCPAVAVEIAPLLASRSTNAAALSDAAYQKHVIDALVAAMAEWREDWKQQP